MAINYTITVTYDPARSCYSAQARKNEKVEYDTAGMPTDKTPMDALWSLANILYEAERQGGEQAQKWYERMQLALEQQKQLKLAQQKPQQVFVVYKNSDMTEGRGPMVMDSVWADKAEAEEYINTKLGVMGRSAIRDHAKLRADYPSGSYPGDCTGWTCPYCWKYGGDWVITHMNISRAKEVYHVG